MQRSKGPTPPALQQGRWAFVRPAGCHVRPLAGHWQTIVGPLLGHCRTIVGPGAAVVGPLLDHGWATVRLLLGHCWANLLDQCWAIVRPLFGYRCPPRSLLDLSGNSRSPLEQCWSSARLFYTSSSLPPAPWGSNRSLTDIHSIGRKRGGAGGARTAQQLPHTQLQSPAGVAQEMQKQPEQTDFRGTLQDGNGRQHKRKQNRASSAQAQPCRLQALQPHAPPCLPPRPPTAHQTQAPQRGGSHVPPQPRPVP